jgi:hypothetical protein
MRSERGVKNATHARAKLGETVWLHMASWPIRIVNLIFQFKSEPEYNLRRIAAKIQETSMQRSWTILIAVSRKEREKQLRLFVGDLLSTK